MTEIMWDILVDAFVDSVKTLPFLFGVYLLIEYMEHHSAGKLVAVLNKAGPFGAVIGALLGAIPQCGFSVAAANLYSGRLISMGTIVAVFLSTSDEAIPMLAANPSSASVLWRLILIKTVIAVAVGIAVDIAVRFVHKESEEEPFKEICAHCDCEHHSILQAALKHTGNIILFIFIVNILLGFAIEFAGEDNLRTFMMTGSAAQPFVTALFGFIPNCAASVVITQLYIEGIVSFGSAIAGLSTGAGVGLLVLFKTNKHYLENLAIMGILYATAVLSGSIINLIL